MALTDEGGGGGIPATMLVGPTGFGNNMPYPYPVYGGGGQGGGMNGWGDGAWIILLIIVLLAAGGGWGNNAGGGGFGQPIVVNDGGGAVQRGFDQAAVMSGINSLTSNVCNGFADVQQSLCNGFAGVNATVNGGFANAETAANARAMANMQQLFGLQSAFSDCCCENRLANADLRYTIATENCADRAAISDGIRDIIANQTAGFQSIKDLLYQDRLDEKNDRISSLERQLTAANLNASQIAQTAQITDSVYNRLATCPVGTVPVFGEQAIFRCNNNNGCGCGCGG